MDDEDFEQFLKERDDVARAYAGGDSKPLAKIATRQSPATFFGPAGGYREGPDDVFADYKRAAEKFLHGGESRLEILQSASSGDLGYWVGYQRGTIRMRGNLNPIPLTLRITEVFRREDGRWKLIHRHADYLAAETGS